MRDEDFFWEGVDQGKLLAQKCAGCGALRHPPTPMCSECQSLEWKAQELSGRGTIYSWVISKHPTQPDASPRTVVLVALEEGIRIVSNLAAGEEVEIGRAVELYFDTVNGARLPQFRLAGGART